MDDKQILDYIGSAPKLLYPKLQKNTESIADT